MKDFFGAVDDDFSAGFADVFDAFENDSGAAGSDAIYALYTRCDECC